MSEEQNADIKALTDKVNALTGLIDGLVKTAEKNSQLADVGLIAPQDTTGHSTKTSMADWLIALKNHNFARLKNVYGSRPVSTKGMDADNGATGAWLLPEQFGLDFVNSMFTESEILKRVNKIMVGSDHGVYPALDITRTPTAGAGNDPMAAGLTSAVRAAGGTFTEATAYVNQILFQTRSDGAVIPVDNELIASSPLAIETLLRQLVKIHIYSKMERNVLRGSGVGEPLGILTDTNTLINVTPGTNNLFSAADAGNMLSRLLVMNPASVAWIMHPGTTPDLVTMQISTGSSTAYMGNLNVGLGMPLLGKPIITSNHLPQDDNSGNVLLVDLSAYALFIQQEIAISYSEHAYFTTGKSAWRFETRYDGRPQMTSVYTLPDPQGSFTQSYAVSHND